MKNAIIYAFSGTGNTAKIAGLYKDEFEKTGVACTVIPITANSVPASENYDILVFAYPIHGFNAPEIMLSFAQKMPQVEHKEYFILKSSGEPLAINNISSLKLVRIFKKKGYVLKGEYHYVMPYNMIFHHTDEMATNMWNTAKALCALEAREVINDESHKLKRIPFGALIACVFRIEHRAMKINGRFFKVNPAKCVNCNKCVKNCPESNISVENGKYVFGKNCIMCACCSFNCPRDAISIGILNGWRVNGAYNMQSTNKNEVGKHKHYCHRAYKRYFESAQKKFAIASVKG